MLSPVWNYAIEISRYANKSRANPLFSAFRTDLLLIYCEFNGKYPIKLYIGI